MSTARTIPPVIHSGPAWSQEYQAILGAYEQAGGNPAVLRMPDVPILVVSAKRVLASNEVPGVHLEAEEHEDGVQAHIVVEPGVQLTKPVHLCFGMLLSEGTQRILAHFKIGAGARVEFLAHCSFPNALWLRHLMNAEIHVGHGAELVYVESHFHVPHGGIEVIPKAAITVEEGGRFLSTFNLVYGRVGRLEVVGPLIEVPVMLVLVWMARRTRERLFTPAAVPVLETESD